jgi:hypothetical protein
MLRGDFASSLEAVAQRLTVEWLEPFGQAYRDLLWAETLCVGRESRAAVAGLISSSSGFQYMDDDFRHCRLR